MSRRQASLDGAIWRCVFILLGVIVFGILVLMLNNIEWPAVRYR